MKCLNKINSISANLEDLCHRLEMLCVKIERRKKKVIFKVSLRVSGSYENQGIAQEDICPCQPWDRLHSPPTLQNSSKTSKVESFYNSSYSEGRYRGIQKHKT
jgi:hypothetical protein